jgi:hypothetical protein
MAHAARFHFDLAQRTEAQRREAMLAGHRWLEAHFSPEAEREALLRSWRSAPASKSPTQPQSDCERASRTITLSSTHATRESLLRW